MADENLCKGWCKKKECEAFALYFFMDASEVHEGQTLGHEVAVGVDDQDVPIKGGKIIMYVKNLPQPVMTDFLLIACCHRIGTYLTNTRRMRSNWATRDVFQVWWEELEKYDGLAVRTICAPELNNIFEDGVQQVRNLLMDINTSEKMYKR